MSSVEDVARRLAAIIDELALLPDGPSPERFHLLQERYALRDEAAQLTLDADAERSTESLETELVSLKGRRRSLVNATGGYVTGGSGDSAGRTGAAFTSIRGQVGSAGGVEQLTVRISRIEDVLAARDRSTA
jgi:hypothetical protein